MWAFKMMFCVVQFLFSLIAFICAKLNLTVQGLAYVVRTGRSQLGFWLSVNMYGKTSPLAEQREKFWIFGRLFLPFLHLSRSLQHIAIGKICSVENKCLNPN
jgi:hypothetical protein